MKSLIIKSKVKRLLKEHKSSIKLNLGCGTDYKEGWINVDNNSDNNIEKLDLNWDLTKPLPFPDNSVDFIFNEHFIEHLSVESARSSLIDFRRVLKKGGVMRIAMPDLEGVVEIYLDKKWKARPFIKTFKLDFIKTKAELLNISLRWWGHQWLYDWEELERRLKETGYKNITQCKRHKSKHNDLQNLEIREESVLIAEVIK